MDEIKVDAIRKCIKIAGYEYHNQGHEYEAEKELEALIKRLQDFEIDNEMKMDRE